MKRPVQFEKGCYYHIYNRGANRETIFREDENYLFLLKRLSEQVMKKKISVIAYCLMTNHYHFLLRQDSDAAISELIQAIFNSYSKAFNKKYNRSGTLFEGRFKSIHVDKENYLIYLCRYIHRNPLEADLVDDITHWPYSNYLECIEKRHGKLVDHQFIKSHFDRPELYQEFVAGDEENSELDKYLF